MLDQGAVTNFLARLAQQSGRLDVLVNNAHSVGRAGTLESAEAKDYADAFASRCPGGRRADEGGTLELLKTAAMRQGYALDDSISLRCTGWSAPIPPSTATVAMYFNPPYYGAAMAGLIHSSTALCSAVHLAVCWHKVRVNAISPGPFPLPALAERMPDFWALLNQKPPMRRVGHAPELQGAVLFLGVRRIDLGQQASTCRSTVDGQPGDCGLYTQARSSIPWLPGIGCFVLPRIRGATRLMN